MKQYKAFRDDSLREAAALKYDADKDKAPRITGLGRGYLAQRMLEEAERSGVQVVQDDKLSHTLHRLSVGDEIPESLYRVVAEILVFIYRMDDRAQDDSGMKRQ